MKTLLDLITIEMKAAFRAAGYDEELAKVTLSNRPDRRDGGSEDLQEGAVYDRGGRGVASL